MLKLTLCEGCDETCNGYQEDTKKLRDIEDKAEQRNDAKMALLLLQDVGEAVEVENEEEEIPNRPKKPRSILINLVDMFD